MVSRQNLQPLARNSTRMEAAGPLLLTPKSAVTVAIALLLLLLGFLVAKLLNRWYKRTRVRDDISDISDHTRHLLQLQKATSRGLLRLNRRRPAMSEAEQRQWQLTVLSMWQSRTVEDDESGQDQNMQMLSRLRSAWLSRRRGHPAASAAGSAGAAGVGSGHPRTAEELRADVRRVALAWLASSREAGAAATRRDRRRRASHYAMMRRLSWAWRQHGQDTMRTIDEAGDHLDGSEEDADDDDESFTTVDLPDWAEAGGAAGFRGDGASSSESGESENAEKEGSEPAGGDVDGPESQAESGGFCQLL